MDEETKAQTLNEICMLKQLVADRAVIESDFFLLIPLLNTEQHYWPALLVQFICSHWSMCHQKDKQISEKFFKKFTMLTRETQTNLYIIYTSECWCVALAATINIDE